MTSRRHRSVRIGWKAWAAECAFTNQRRSLYLPEYPLAGNDPKGCDSVEKVLVWEPGYDITLIQESYML